MRASVIIRTLNEERHLNELLEAVHAQDCGDTAVEVVLVDSGSSDRTLEIATGHGCRIERIERREFSFGRSLNRGCAASSGDVLVFVSGHCVPATTNWLAQLIAPLLTGESAYTYGRQAAGPESHFSEAQLFRRQYPEASRVPQEGIFCNNANAALRRDVWEKYGFDEELTGLEDMDLARRCEREGLRIGYVAEACVTHHHYESWREVGWRFEREAIALQKILPDIQLRISDVARYLASALLHDLRAAGREGVLWHSLLGIIHFRWAQYLGSYRGNHAHRRLSRERKEHYFYPRSGRSGDSGEGGT